jgi:hypothetical protein
MKEECSDPLTKSVSASVPSNSVIESVADPVTMATQVDSLSLSNGRDGFAKPKLWAPAPSQRLLKLKSASSLVPSNSVIEPVADPAMMAIRVDNLSWAAERAGSDKSKHGPPVLIQRSLKIAEGLLQ